jgi:hypothetical protein
VKGILSELGFQDIVITPKRQSYEIVRAWHVGEGAEKVVFSAYIKAAKPEKARKCGLGTDDINSNRGGLKHS